MQVVFIEIPEAFGAGNGREFVEEKSALAG
jgi:hypothetical protein